MAGGHCPLVLFALAAWAGAGEVCVSPPPQPSSGPIAEVRAPLTSCQKGTNDIEIEFGGRELRIDVSGAGDDRLASDAYRRLVGSLYALEGDCPPPGTHIRVTTCSVCRHMRVVAVEIGGKDAFDSESAHLWLYRKYVNLAAPLPEDGFAVSIVSLVLARHNRRDGQRRQLWIRDVLGHALDTYSGEDRAYAFIRTFGTKDLDIAVPELVKIARLHRDDVGVIQALPFMPSDPKAAPFVGAWGTFATQVLLEGRAGTLDRLFGPTAFRSDAHRRSMR